MNRPNSSYPVLLAALLALTAATGPACMPPRPQTASEGSGDDGDEAYDELPIRRVVLYRSGIAYVERQGTTDGQTLALQVQPDQINDILTTLTIIVDGGDNVASSVGLPIERNVAHDLDALPPQVRQDGGVLALLRAFRGAHVRIEGRSANAEGRVVGTESLANEEGHQIQYVTILGDGGELRQFAIADIRRVDIENRSFEIGLERSLDVSLGEGDWKPVELTVHLSGSPPHDVFMSYVVAMPTWKPTYRVIQQGDEARIQGWAVVDNVSGEAWDSVALSLVAGTPISFRYDLHTPRFVSRPDLTARGFSDQSALVAPSVDDGLLAPGAAATGSAARPRAAREQARAEASLDRYARPEEEAAEDEGGWAPPPPQNLMAAAGPSAEGAALDNLFRYDLPHGVTVADRGSALVTLLNESVDAENVLYFDPRANADHPYRALRLRNDTGFTLERGPLSIYSDGTFVGQAIGPRISEDEQVFLPYSVDARLRVSERTTTGDEGVRLVRIADGVITSEVQQVNRRTLQVINNTGETARLFVRVPKRANWFLRAPESSSPDVIDQGDVWFVGFDLSAEGSQEIVLEEATTTTRSVEVWSEVAADTFAVYVSRDDADPALAEGLRQILEQRSRIAALERDIEQARTRRQDAYQRIAELRESVTALGDRRTSRELRERLEQRLGEQEDTVASLTETIVAAEDEVSELRTRINAALLELELSDPSAGPDR